MVSLGGNDIKIKDFELRAKPPQGPQAQALTVSDSPVYHALSRCRIYNPDTNTVKNTLVQFEFDFYFSNSLEQLQQKKENTELINADRKPYKNDNLKYNK